MTGLQGYVLHAGEGVSGYESDVKASKASTGGMLTLIESHTDGGAPLHVHTHEDECFYVVEGSIVVTCGDQVFQAEARSFVYLPRGVPHGWDVTSGKAVVLMITIPGMLEEFLHEYHQASGNERTEIATRYGVTFLPQSR